MSQSAISDLAAATPAVPFLNLQYFYCVISSYVGKACGARDIPLPDVTLPTTTLPTTPSADGGFWSWLWPFGSSGTDVVTATTSAANDVGFWAGTYSALPDSLQNIVWGVGSVISFLWSTFSVLSYTTSFLLFMVILIAGAGIIVIRLQEWEAHNTLPRASAVVSKNKQRWQDLLNEAMAAEPRRWREAVIAADGQLGILLTRLGYGGPTTGDQMRAIPEGAFVTLPAAWEAHRIKNFVSARSTDYILTQREAFRVMKLYEQVFEEFDFI